MHTIVSGSRATPVIVFFFQEFHVSALYGKSQGQDLCDVLNFNLLIKVCATYTWKRLSFLTAG